MRKIVGAFLISVCVLSFLSCSSSRPASATQSGPRTIILDGEKYIDDVTGNFVSWYGKDYVNPGAIKVEVGFFSNPNLEGYGFILFDGGYTGEVTKYQRTGLEHRWDWGPNGNEFSFVIKTNGTGLYYDFTLVEGGTSTKARSVYKCYKR